MGAREIENLGNRALEGVNWTKEVDVRQWECLKPRLWYSYHKVEEAMGVRSQNHWGEEIKEPRGQVPRSVM